LIANKRILLPSSGRRGVSDTATVSTYVGPLDVPDVTVYAGGYNV
jgi:hypothetical protein